MVVVEINWSEYEGRTRSAGDANDIGKRARPSHWLFG